MKPIQLIILSVLLLGLFFYFVDPIRQPQSYHNFADQRTFLQIPNFFDVTSNAPFLLVGLLGLSKSRNTFKSTFFYLTVCLVCLGSAYYHWQPNNQTLVWDRLPMSLGFMAILVQVLADSGISSACNSMAAFLAFEAIGLVSVIIWALFDDLRLYGIVQFGSMAALLLILLTRSFSGKVQLCYALFFYTAAKLSEHFDRQIYALLFHSLSGHSLKHMIAAVATYFSGLYLQKYSKSTF